jgi:predicted transcriptional regulator
LKAIPEIVRQFLTKYIHSVDVLEILLLLRQDPQKEWGTLDLSNALRAERISVEARLQQLVSAGLVLNNHLGTEQVFRYHPTSAALDRTVSELAKWFSSHRVAVINLIYSGPSEQIRIHPYQTGDEDKS